MKRLKLFLIAAMVLLFAVQTSAQVSLTIDRFSDRALLIQFPSTNIDSTGDTYSEWFTLDGYGQYEPYISVTDTADGFTTAYVPVPLYGTYQITSTAGKPRITWILQGSNNPDVSATIATAYSVSATADSTETLQTANITPTIVRAYYRFKITGTSGNRTDTYARGEWYLPRARNKN